MLIRFLRSPSPFHRCTFPVFSPPPPVLARFPFPLLCPRFCLFPLRSASCPFAPAALRSCPPRVFPLALSPRLSLPGPAPRPCVCVLPSSPSVASAPFFPCLARLRVPLASPLFCLPWLASPSPTPSSGLPVPPVAPCGRSLLPWRLPAATPPLVPPALPPAPLPFRRSPRRASLRLALPAPSSLPSPCPPFAVLYCAVPPSALASRRALRLRRLLASGLLSPLPFFRVLWSRRSPPRLPPLRWLFSLRPLLLSSLPLVLRLCLLAAPLRRPPACLASPPVRRPRSCRCPLLSALCARVGALVRPPPPTVFLRCRPRSLRRSASASPVGSLCPPVRPLLSLCPPSYLPCPSLPALPPALSLSLLSSLFLPPLFPSRSLFFSRSRFSLSSLSLFLLLIPPSSRPAFVGYPSRVAACPCASCRRSRA